MLAASNLDEIVFKLMTLKTIIVSCNHVTATATQNKSAGQRHGCSSCSSSKKTSHFSLAEITHKGVCVFVCVCLCVCVCVCVWQMVSVSTSCLELAENEQYHSVKTAARSEPPSEENTCLQYEEGLRDTA